MYLVKAAGELIRDTYLEWVRDRASQLGAAIAFYTALSLAPLLVFVVSVTAIVFGQDAAQGELLAQTQEVAGADAARTIELIIEHTSSPRTGLLASIIGLSILLFGASGVFWQAKHALNKVWKIERKPESRMRGVIAFLKDRGKAALMVLGAGSLLILSMLLDTALSTVRRLLLALAPHLDEVFRAVRVAQGIKFGLSLIILTLVFAIIYRTLPDARVARRDVWIGAAVTALLLSAGNLVLGLVLGIYLSNSTIRTAYGAAGSVLAFLIWVYYSAQVFFVGAEFTQVWANRYGSGIVPNDNAVLVVRERLSRRELLEPPALEEESAPPADPALSEAEQASRKERVARWLKKNRRFGGIAAASTLFAVGVLLGWKRFKENGKCNYSPHPSRRPTGRLPPERPSKARPGGEVNGRRKRTG